MGCRLDQALQALPWGLLLGLQTLFDLAPGQGLLGRTASNQPRCGRQGVSGFQQLRSLDGRPSLPLSQPHLTGHINPAGHDVHMVVVCVVMAHDGIWRPIRKTHFSHEVADDGQPPIRLDHLPSGQG